MIRLLNDVTGEVRVIEATPHTKKDEAAIRQIIKNDIATIYSLDAIPKVEDLKIESDCPDTLKRLERYYMRTLSPKPDPFWEEKVRYKDAGDLAAGQYLVARMENVHYILIPKGDAGFTGMTMAVEFIDGPHKGRKVYCQNIWCQGNIPPHYKSKLPNNAVQLKWWEMTPEQLNEIKL